MEAPSAPRLPGSRRGEPDRRRRSIELRDGRALAYAEYGDPSGAPLLYFHGFPGSRLEGAPMDGPARALGLRVIAPDRPGMGCSSYKPGRELADWPDDAAELADSLGLGAFAVLGVSGGGPYAAACAWKIPGRLSSVSLAAGLGPFDRPDAAAGMREENARLFAAAARSPWKLLPAFWLEKIAWNERAMARLVDGMQPVDREAMRARPDMVRALYESTGESLRRGARGVARDALIYAGPWGFDLSEIEAKVHLWQGEADVNVPPEMGLYQARALANCEPHFIPGEGHYSLIANHLEEILAKAKNP